MLSEKFKGLATKTLYELEQPESNRHFDFYKLVNLEAADSGQQSVDFDKFGYKKING